jgi:hypothetical protein
MARRRTAREMEAAAAAWPIPLAAGRTPDCEPIAMLLRRGLKPRIAPLDVPFPKDIGGPAAERLAAKLGHYAFRLFLRGAILRRGEFAPGEATRYLGARPARGLAEWLVGEGLALRGAGGRYRLAYPARSFGGTLEWWLARELEKRLGFETVAGVKSGARGAGGDLDVVATAEGKLVYLEAKSSPPKHLTRVEVAAFLRRVHLLRPDVALFVMDTALRLSDKVLPMFASELGKRAPEPRRILRETWALAPHLYAVNAKEDLVENLCRAVAEGFLSLGPLPPH